MDVQVSEQQIAWEAAHRAVSGALRKAAECGVRVCAAVVDTGGNRVAFVRMNGAPLHSITIAEDKAYTAVSFGLSTRDWLQELKSHSEAVQQGIPFCNRFVMFGGGLPIRVDGRVIGGIGVSGATEDQDEACARAGLVEIGIAS